MEILQSLGSNPWTIIASNFYTAVFAVLILWIGYKIGKDDGSYILNWLISLLGVLIGWILGILATPFDGVESQKFLTIGQSISVFLSGYVISKLDRFFEASLYQEGNPKKESWINPLLRGRVERLRPFTYGTNASITWLSILSHDRILLSLLAYFILRQSAFTQEADN